MQALVEKLHTKGQRWVPIVDPGIMVNPEVMTHRCLPLPGAFNCQQLKVQTGSW